MEAEYFKSTGYLWVSILPRHQPATVTGKFRNKFKILLGVRINLYIYRHKFFFHTVKVHINIKMSYSANNIQNSLMTHSLFSPS